MIVIPGDLFDQPVDFSCEDVDAVCLWLLRLMHFCHNNGIVLRVMEGTPSHDSKQSKITKILEAQVPGLDFKYISDITVEHIDKLGVDVLYVPDRIRPNERQSFADAKQLMSEQGLDKVDITFTHGMYRHHAEYKINPDHLHFEEDYLSITRHFIHNGHIHTPTTHDRVLTHGSFDRLKQGEEHAKGGIIATIYDDPSKDTHVFVENKLAQKYVRVRLRSMDVDACLKKIDRAISQLPSRSYVEICAKSTHPLIAGFAELKASYPSVFMSKDTSDSDKAKTVSTKEEKQNEYVPLIIDPSNIVDLILSNLSIPMGVYEQQELHATLQELV